MVELTMDKNDEESLLDLGHCVLHLWMYSIYNSLILMIQGVNSARVDCDDFNFFQAECKFAGSMSESRDFKFTNFSVFHF